MFAVPPLWKVWMRMPTHLVWQDTQTQQTRQTIHRGLYARFRHQVLARQWWAVMLVVVGRALTGGLLRLLWGRKLDV
jgi:hypothetical protein